MLFPATYANTPNAINGAVDTNIPMADVSTPTTLTFSENAPLSLLIYLLYHSVELRLSIWYNSYTRYGGEVVTQRSAKPPFTGSNPVRTSQNIFVFFNIATKKPQEYPKVIYNNQSTGNYTSRTVELKSTIPLFTSRLKCKDA